MAEKAIARMDAPDDIKAALRRDSVERAIWMALLAALDEKCQGALSDEFYESAEAMGVSEVDLMTAMKRSELEWAAWERRASSQI